ncbi:rhodanese-like domain-containing protein [Yoonia sp. 2307UL14-13]|uniref:rhodanese-like domain-containing protein n=1 Tax=Yoonia sp. 2307UL14-13 TaxID=3126506 RepID=UPI0030B25193
MSRTTARAWAQICKLSLATAFVFSAMPVQAQDVLITPELPFLEFDTGSEFVFIERNQDPEARIPDFFSQTSRQCPPFCVQPMSAGEGVETVGELEVLAFLEEHVAKGTGVLIDARLREWYDRGTIPGAMSLSFTTFENPDSNPFLVPVLQLLGGEQANGAWTFDDPLELTMFCNGPWCGQSHRAIENLLSVGYPPEKIRYYRGGMQGWLSVGLTVVTPAGS